MTRNPVSPAVREIVLARADGACEVCWWQRVEQIHHRMPRGAGGAKNRPGVNLPANLLGLCAADHRAVESNRTNAYRYGWLVRQGSNPAEVPVLRYGSEWVLLTDSGEVIPTTPPEGEHA